MVGIGGMRNAGAVGGMLMAKYRRMGAGQHRSYTPIFIVAQKCIYLLALLTLHVLSPRMAPVQIYPAAPVALPDSICG